MSEQVNPRDLSPGMVVRHTSGGTVTLERRKEDDSGWWNTDGSGLADSVWTHGAWTVAGVQSFAFQPHHDGSLDLRDAVFQALGAASMCWSERPRGVFESDRAKDIGEALLAFIRKSLQPWSGIPDTGRSEGGS